MSDDVKNLIDEIGRGMAAMQTEVQAVKAGMDPVAREKTERAIADLAAKSEKLDAAIAAEREERRKLAAAVSRAGQDGGDAGEAAERRKLNEWLAKGDHFAKEVHIVERKGMSSDSNPNGGFLVMPELSATIVGRVFESSPLREVANVEVTGSSSRKFLVDDNSTAAEWSGEKASATEATEAVGEKEISVHNVRRKMRATNDMLSDAYVDLAAWLAGKASLSISRAENTAFVAGNGVAKPRGFLTYPAWAAPGVYERDKIEQIDAGTSSALDAGKIIAVQGALKEAYQANAVWGMKRATYFAAVALKSSDQFYFGPTVLRDGSMGFQLLGKRVVFMDDMESVGANSLSLVYADFRAAYTILDRAQGITILRDPYTEHPYTVFHASRRTGGDVTSFDGIKIGKVPS